MFRSLFRLPTKSRGHEDAEKELVEVMDLFSKYPSHLAESDKTEFKNEHDRHVLYIELSLFIYDIIYRLQREIQVYKAGKSTSKLRNVDIILDDCRALKCKVKVTIPLLFLRGSVLISNCRRRSMIVEELLWKEKFQYPHVQVWV